MRHFLVILIVLLGSGLSVRAEDILLGRVVSIDRDNGTVFLIVLDAPEHVKRGIIKAPAGISNETADPAKIVLNIPLSLLLTRVYPGTLVRLWVRLDEGGAFTIEKAVPVGTAGSLSDPTGVRRRLGSRHRGSYSRKTGGPDSRGR